MKDSALMPKNLKTMLATLLTVGTLQGCAAAVVGGAAATGAAVIHDRRTAGAVVDDQRIELDAYHLKYKHGDINKHSSINITSYNGKVLLTGTAASTQMPERFAGLVAAIQGVREVVNEISIGPLRSAADTARDTYITSKVKISLFGVDGKLSDPTPFKVVTSAGVVYLMGLTTRKEGDAAAEQIRYIDGVKRVVKLFEYR